MNSRIFNMVYENLKESFNLPKYKGIMDALDETTVLESLPWTPARFEKFKAQVSQELGFTDLETRGTIEQFVAALDERYLHRFFGEIWMPTTEKYSYSGWALVDEINRHNPRAVLDYGCGYNQFKGRIQNLVGIDPYNNCADYMVDITEFVVPLESYDVIMVLGSLNFNDIDGIKERFARLVSLLAPGGRMYFRANPGQLWPDGLYVDIFPWDFKLAHDLAKEHMLELETFKKDYNRIYFVYKK